MKNREPSVHITRSTLYGLIVKHIGVDFGSCDEKAHEYGSLNLLDRVDIIMKEARSYSLDHRSIGGENKKVRNQAIRRASSNIGDANLLADIIYSTRIKLKHIGVSKIKQTDAQWASVKELVPIVNEFCQRFGFEPRNGYIEFVTTGLKLMAQAKRVNYNFCANWLHQRVNWILDVYQSEKEVKDDKYPVLTRELYEYYTREILDRVGISNIHDKNPQEYVWFVRARELADNLGVDYETFVQAQFYALEFCNGIPKIEDLSNDKARQRVITYMAKFNIVTRPKVDKVNWDEFKK